MKIESSSAEFEINSNINHLLFGSPKYFESGQFVNLGQTTGYKNWTIKLNIEDIDKISMWQEYKDEIKNLYNSDSIYLQKDVCGQDWISIGGSGWGCNWTVNATDFRNYINI